MTPVLPPTLPVTEPLTKALKEWAIAVRALTQGETILLLRKGGIREQSFAVAQSQFWLYPTYEHQKPQLLKSAYANQVSLVKPGWHPETVEISAWATVTHWFEVSDPATVAALLPFHIWTEAFVTERLKWKPRLPLSVLLLRVYRLAEAQQIAYRTEYGGCKSWIDLSIEASPQAGTPILAEADYSRQVEAIMDLQ
jgi:hypothetical protein